MKYFFAIFLVMVSSEALACSCAKIGREETIANSDAVVKGAVVSITETGMAIEAIVHVDEYIKGNDAPSITVRTANQSAACGIELKPGQQVELALHKRDDGSYSANSCSQWGLSYKPANTEEGGVYSGPLR